MEFSIDDYLSFFLYKNKFR
ncbi:hypothetical protein YPPY89_3790, partial [Yersinia pestis PY-89]